MGINIVFATSEAVPFAKTGGLADVSGSLPSALKALGGEICLFMPLYREIKEGSFDLESTGVKVVIPVGEKDIECEIFTSRAHGGVTAYFLKRDEYFDRSGLYGGTDGDYFDNLERFIFFSRGVIEAARALEIKPDIIHCNDWQTGLIPAYIKDIYSKDPFFKKTATLFTIHNLAYQGLFPPEFFKLTNLSDPFFTFDGLEFWDKLSLLKSGLTFSDIITTVSETYAAEIQTKRFGAGMDDLLKHRKNDLHGILNGVDYDVWNPETDSLIEANFTADDLSGKRLCKEALLKEFGLPVDTERPLIGVVSRLVDQKGFDIVTKAARKIVDMGFSLVLIGTGEGRYEEFFRKLATSNPGSVGVRIGYNEGVAHRIEAGADIFLMASRYEPCGLNQIYSLKYGTIPVVRATGGLNDTIRNFTEPGGNGFKFKGLSVKTLLDTLSKALSLYKDKVEWRELMVTAMNENYSWEKSAARYMELYRTALEGYAPPPKRLKKSNT